MVRNYIVSIRRDTGIAQAMEKYCEQKGLPLNGFMVQAVREKLTGMDVHSMTVDEIEERERDYNDVRRYL